MKIIHQAPDLLIIEQKPTQFTAWVLGIATVISFFFIVNVVSQQAETRWLAATFAFTLWLTIPAQTVRQLTIHTCKIDKNRQTLTLKRKNLFGEKVFKHSLNEIKNVRSIEIDYPGYRCEIRIELANGSHFALNEWRATDDRSNAKEITLTIQCFLYGR
jgi:hypothetical protein